MRMQAHFLLPTFRVAIAWVSSDDPYTWKGYALAGSLLAANFVIAILYHQFFKYSYMTAYRMRSVLIAAIYRKVCLSLDHNNIRNTEEDV